MLSDEHGHIDQIHRGWLGQYSSVPAWGEGISEGQDHVWCLCVIVGVFVVVFQGRVGFSR